MYQIDKSSNNIIKLEQRLFGEIGIREREHLQEWIAKNPEVLGEELLIIQKEFSGFNDTNERLDLLAIDKEGNLVIIENKLDDTGRDVTWQALKYTSYCSTLTTSQIIKLFQDYLNRYSKKEDAKTLLIEFLEREEEGMLLNGGDQRIIFVANNYRKEVTSTVLWLIEHNVHIQCFRATPYTRGEDVFLQIEQIIPLPETAEYMIDAREKEKEEKEKSKIVAQTDAMLLDFWSALKQNLAEHNVQFLDRVSAKSSFDIGTWKGKGKFSFCLGRKANRVELYFNSDPDKVYFEAMLKHREEIESKFHGRIVWERLNGKKASRIKYEMPKEATEGYLWNDKATWPICLNWFRESMVDFYSVVYPVWERVQKAE